VNRPYLMRERLCSGLIVNSSTGLSAPLIREATFAVLPMTVNSIRSGEPMLASLSATTSAEYLSSPP